MATSDAPSIASTRLRGFPSSSRGQGPEQVPAIQRKRAVSSATAGLQPPKRLAWRAARIFLLGDQLRVLISSDVSPGKRVEFQGPNPRASPRDTAEESSELCDSRAASRKTRLAAASERDLEDLRISSSGSGRSTGRLGRGCRTLVPSTSGTSTKAQPSQRANRAERAAQSEPRRASRQAVRASKRRACHRGHRQARR